MWQAVIISPIIAISLLAVAGCSKPADMPVAFAAAGSLQYDLRPGTWDVGEVKDCEVATHTDKYADKGKDLLLCGMNVQLAWSGAEKSDGEKGSEAKDHNYEILISLNAKTFAVTFHGKNTPLAVLSNGESLPKTWRCQRTADGIDCR